MTEIFLFLAFASFSTFLYILSRRQNRIYTMNTIKSLNKLVEALHNMLQNDKQAVERMVEYHELHCLSHKLVLEALQFTLFSIKDHLIETEQYEAIQDIDSIIAEVQTAIIINADTDEDDSNS